MALLPELLLSGQGLRSPSTPSKTLKQLTETPPNFVHWDEAAGFALRDESFDCSRRFAEADVCWPAQCCSSICCKLTIAQRLKSLALHPGYREDAAQPTVRQPEHPVRAGKSIFSAKHGLSPEQPKSAKGKKTCQLIHLFTAKGRRFSLCLTRLAVQPKKTKFA